MYKIGAIGSADSITSFKAVGIEVFAADDFKEASRLLKELHEKGFAVIFITEQLAAGMLDEIDRYRELKLPSIVLIPGNEGSLGIGMKQVSKSVERAVGADIL